MSSAPAPDPNLEQLEVAALRKKIRGEPLTDAEVTLLASATRKPAAGVTFTQEQVTALLAARARADE
jgi:hypothetical protein